MKTIIVILGIATVIILAVELPNFNKIGPLKERVALSSDDGPQEAEFEHPLSRTARHAEGDEEGYLSIYECCCGSETLTAPEDIIEDFKACENEQSGDGSNFLCAVECLGKKKDIADKDGYAIPETFQEIVPVIFSDETFKLTAQAVAVDCATKANERAKKKMENAQGNMTCNPAIFRAVKCCKYAVEKTCPEDKKINSERCMKFRQQMEEKLKEEQQQ